MENKFLKLFNTQSKNRIYLNKKYIERIGINFEEFEKTKYNIFINHAGCTYQWGRLYEDLEMAESNLQMLLEMINE